MMHEVETMAYAYDDRSSDEAYSHPWHVELTKDRSVPVAPGMSVSDMMVKAGLDWDIDRVPSAIEHNGSRIETGDDYLVRSSDSSILTRCSQNWHEVGPQAFVDFFHDFCENGEMEMNTLGSLRGGKHLFALARVGSEFTLNFPNGADVIHLYFLFSNPIMYGQAIDLRFTPTRVVCMNTLSLAINKDFHGVVRHKAPSGVKLSHRKPFDADEVKSTLKIAERELQGYKEAAEYMSARRYSIEDLKRYYLEVFQPKDAVGNPDVSSVKPTRKAVLAMESLDAQAGAELGRGTWWQAYNSVTYAQDHLFGRTDENRLYDAWFSGGRDVKIQALSLAIEYAERSKSDHVMA